VFAGDKCPQFPWDYGLGDGGLMEWKVGMREGGKGGWQGGWCDGFGRGQQPLSSFSPGFAMHLLKHFAVKELRMSCMNSRSDSCSR
jgi:hypothetical protein